MSAARNNACENTAYEDYCYRDPTTRRLVFVLDGRFMHGDDAFDYLNGSGFAPREATEFLRSLERDRRDRMRTGRGD